MGVNVALAAHRSSRRDLSDIFKSNRRGPRGHQRRIDRFLAARARIFPAGPRSAEHAQSWRPRFSAVEHRRVGEHLLRLGLHGWRRAESFAGAYDRRSIAFQTIWREV